MTNNQIENLRLFSSRTVGTRLIVEVSIYLDKLKRQKQGLMHDLLTGKVRVNLNE
jgi:hypothetical protein